YKGAVWFLIARGALAAAIAWRWTLAMLNATGAATFAWAAIALSAPFMFNTFTVYPEIAAALAVMIAFVITQRSSVVQSGMARWVAAGLAIASLPWLSTKYAPMSAALLLVVFSRLGKNDPATFLRNSKIWVLAGV